MIHTSHHRVANTGAITGESVPLPTLTHPRTSSKDRSLPKERRVLHNCNDAKHTHQQPTRAVGSRRNRKAQRGHHNLHSTQPAVHRRLHPGAQRAHTQRTAGGAPRPQASPAPPTHNGPCSATHQTETKAPATRPHPPRSMRAQSAASGRGTRSPGSRRSRRTHAMKGDSAAPTCRHTAGRPQHPSREHAARQRTQAAGARSHRTSQPQPHRSRHHAQRRRQQTSAHSGERTPCSASSTATTRCTASIAKQAAQTLHTTTKSRAQGRTATAATQLTGRRSRARCQRGSPANRLATRCSTEAAAQRPMADPVRLTRTRIRRSASGHPCESRDPSTSWQRSRPERQPQFPKRL